MDEQEMEHTQERIFEGPYCRRHIKSKKILSMEVTDEHTHTHTR